MIANILISLGTIALFVVVVAYNARNKVCVKQAQCGCGKSSSEYCDNSHAESESASSTDNMV